SGARRANAKPQVWMENSRSEYQASYRHRRHQDVAERVTAEHGLDETHNQWGKEASESAGCPNQACYRASLRGVILGHQLENRATASAQERGHGKEAESQQNDTG